MVRTIKRNGHVIKCECCKKKNAKYPLFGLLVCGSCVKPLSIGFFVGRNYDASS